MQATMKGVIHVGHIKSAIHKRFDTLIDVSDVPASQIEDHFLTRGLAAYAVAELADTEDPIAANSVVDQYGDNGIDAVYFDSSRRVCYIVQSKWIKNGDGSLDVGAILKFKQGVNHFFLAQFDSFGSKIQARQSEILEILGDSRNTFVLVVAYTGQQDLAPEVQAPLDELLSELNDPTDMVQLEKLKLSDLHARVSQEARGSSIKMEILLKEFGVIKEPYEAFYGQVDLKDIATWGKYGTYLSSKNIRGFKGSTEVNEAITHTIKSNPMHFWYFNNGITIVADKVNSQHLGSGSRESRVFELEGASVVNGAQTVGSIVAAINAGINGIGNARVPVRIISLEGCPEEFGKELTKAANTQNRIENKDFVAQDPQQEQLQSDLYLENGKRYVFKTGDREPSASDGFTFEDAAIALACAHPDLQWSVQAKREVGKLWEDIHKPPYVLFFNTGTSAMRMWRAVEIMRVVEKALKDCQANYEGKAKLIGTHGNRFLLHVIFRSGVDPNDTDLNALQTKARDLVEPSLNRLINASFKLYEGAYPSNLFKNLTKCKAILEEVMKPEHVVEEGRLF